MTDDELERQALGIGWKTTFTPTVIKKWDGYEKKEVSFDQGETWEIAEDPYKACGEK